MLNTVRTVSDDPSQLGAVALLEPGAPAPSAHWQYQDSIPYGDPRFGKVLAAWLMPRLAAALSPIQRHVLARIAVHTWGHEEEIPFYAPNFHQLAAALDLVEHNLVWWEEQFTPERRLAFGLTTAGAWVVNRVCHVVPTLLNIRQEIEFDRMQVFMRNEWETGDDVDAAPASPAPKRKRRLRLIK